MSVDHLDTGLKRDLGLAGLLGESRGPAGRAHAVHHQLLARQ